MYSRLIIKFNSRLLFYTAYQPSHITLVKINVISSLIKLGHLNKCIRDKHRQYLMSSTHNGIFPASFSIHHMHFNCNSRFKLLEKCIVNFNVKLLHAYVLMHQTSLLKHPS